MIQVLDKPVRDDGSAAVCELTGSHGTVGNPFVRLGYGVAKYVDGSVIVQAGVALGMLDPEQSAELRRKVSELEAELADVTNQLAETNVAADTVERAKLIRAHREAEARLAMGEPLADDPLYAAGVSRLAAAIAAEDEDDDADR